MSNAIKYTFFVALNNTYFLKKMLGEERTISVSFDLTTENELLNHKKHNPFVLCVTLESGSVENFAILFVSKDKKQAYVRQATAIETEIHKVM